MVGIFHSTVSLLECLLPSLPAHVWHLDRGPPSQPGAKARGLRLIRVEPLAPPTGVRWVAVHLLSLCSCITACRD